MFRTYIQQINKIYRSGLATEHSYRPALHAVLSLILKDTEVTNEPKRQKCGAPDYIITRNKIYIGYVEAKDIGIDLDKVERGSKVDDQWSRYATSLDNIILTDFAQFRFFRNGHKVEEIRIAEPTKGSLTPLPANFGRLQSLLLDFAAFEGQPIKSAKKLAEMMAHKAALMRDVFFKAVTDEDDDAERTLQEQLDAFAWNFVVGCYQPAQKWLKDRKGRKLSADDLHHWQRVVVALAETDRVMGEIDKIEFLPT